MMGQLTVWSGKRGEGKSTFLGQVIIEAAESGHTVCAYSGELQATYFQYCIDLQCAGVRNIQLIHDPLKGEAVPCLSSEIRNKIHNWYRGKFYIYDNSIAQSSESDNILKVFEYAVKRYDCKVFMVDNLMTVRHDGGERDFYRQQSKFTGELMEFSKKYNVHIHLVAHPRKTSGDLEGDDISGSGDISNRADNVITVKRLSDSEKEVNGGCDSVIRVIKNRFYGKLGEIGLKYCPKSRRYYLPSEGNIKNYSWVNMCGGAVDIDCLNDLPW